MRCPTLFLMVVAALASPATTRAQVSTDNGALDSLKPDTPATTAAPKAKAPARTTRRNAHSAPTGRKTVVLPVVPAAPPTNPVLAPPPFVMPAHKPPPPPVVPVKTDAQGEAASIPDGVRVTFGPGSSDLNPATYAALKTLAATMLAHPDAVIGITAFAPGVPDDPSTPRRVSLDRALAARAVLINAGIVSDRIRAVASGPQGIGDGPADRADVVQVVKPAPPVAAPTSAAGRPAAAAGTVPPTAKPPPVAPPSR